MRSHKFLSRATCLAITTLFLTACGNDTASNLNSNAKPRSAIPTLPPAPRVSLSEENFVAVAGSTLKTILLSDASAAALDQAVTVTRTRGSEVGNDLATGVRLTFTPMPCATGGSFIMDLVAESNTDDLQIGFNNELNLLLKSEFLECDQGFNRLTGNITLDFKAVLNDLINNSLYDFSGNVQVNDLIVDQSGYYPFFFDGNLFYRLSSPDGISVTTEIISSGLSYSADQTYQLEDFHSVKSVNLNSQSYSYSLTGTYIEEIGATARTIDYSTLAPLQGQGFSLPTTGKVLVRGDGQILAIEALDQEMVNLKLDVDGDGTVDHEYLSTWRELVLNELGPTG